MHHVSIELWWKCFDIIIPDWIELSTYDILSWVDCIFYVVYTIQGKNDTLSFIALDKLDYIPPPPSQHAWLRVDAEMVNVEVAIQWVTKKYFRPKLKKKECMATDNNVFVIDNEKKKFYKGIICMADRCLNNIMF